MNEKDRRTRRVRMNKRKQRSAICAAVVTQMHDTYVSLADRAFLVGYRDGLAGNGCYPCYSCCPKMYDSGYHEGQHVRSALL